MRPERQQGKKQEYHENPTRKRSGKPSKVMVMPRRGAHYPKSASFQTVPEHVQTDH